jgi:SAM-dependent methyltransferase
MLAVARTRYPGARWEQGDLRAVGELPAGAYDVVVLAWNVIDVLDDATRREFLGAVRRVLTPDGLLIFSSHNLAAADTRGDATRVRRDTPKHLVRDLLTLPRRWRNHRRRAPYEVHADDHAILNDLTHDFSAMHYYIGRDAQQRQLEAAGFELLECRDLDGRLVAPGEAAAGSSELHYVARPG